MRARPSRKPVESTSPSVDPAPSIYVHEEATHGGGVTDLVVAQETSHMSGDKLSDSSDRDSKDWVTVSSTAFCSSFPRGKYGCFFCSRHGSVCLPVKFSDADFIMLVCDRKIIGNCPE